MKPAFSYIRFSSPEQAKGDSFRRQSVAAAKWADENGYTIVQSLEDLGISAFRGQNQHFGDFGEFLAAAESGRLPKDSVLIVESLDRLSRQEPHRALAIFLRLLHAKVAIMTLADGVKHTANFKDDPMGMKLFGALMVMIRAHGESWNKSNRVALAWENKRSEARSHGVALTDRIPGWLDSNRDAAGRRVFIENDHADTVRRIFAETAQGFGRRMIIKRLNREGTKTFQAKYGWHTSTVAKIVANRTALGEYQPCKRDEETGKSIPDGPPILNYYPAVVDEALWVQANAAIRLRRRDGGGRPQQQNLNLIPGLGRCICGARMAFLNKGKPPKGGQYYACSAARRGLECTNIRLWPAKAVERYLIDQIDPGRLDDAVEPVELSGPPPRQFDAEIADLEAQRQGAIASILRNPYNALGAEMEALANKLAEKIEEVRKQRDVAVAEERTRPHLPTIKAALQDFAVLVSELENASTEDKLALRMRLTHQIRIAFAEIVFGPHTISGLIALPGMPKSMKGWFGIPKPIVVRSEKDGTQRWFYRHTIFTDEPEALDAMGGGTGILSARPSKQA